MTRDKINDLAAKARIKLNDFELDNLEKEIPHLLNSFDLIKDFTDYELRPLGLNIASGNISRADEEQAWSERGIRIAWRQIPEQEGDQVRVNRVI